MAIADTTARNSRASAFSQDFSTAQLTILDGAVVLATHTLAGFGAPATGVITAAAIPDVTIGAGGTADGAKITDTAGVYTLTLGLSGSGSDVIVTTTNYINGETSSISDLAVTFPA